MDKHPEPLFNLTSDGAFAPDPLLRGPFDGLQGGAVAALMCAAVEDAADNAAASVTTHFLKPVPLRELTVVVKPLRMGRRVSVVDAELRGGGELLAVQRVTIIRPLHEDLLLQPRRAPASPALHPLQQREAPHGLSWMMDAMEVRTAPDGVHWFRLKRPVVHGGRAMSGVLPAADWAHGIAPPLGYAVRPLAAIPNPDMTAHLFRAPVDDWIGVAPQSAWSAQSVGAGWAALYDVEGLIGRAAMSVAVTLIGRDPT